MLNPMLSGAKLNYLCKGSNFTILIALAPPLRSHPSLSKPFVTNNDVKKGGVLLPVLFIYIVYISC